MEVNQQFNKVYVEFKPIVTRIAKRFCRTSRVPYEEFESQLSEEVWIAYTKFREDKGASLNTWMATRLRDRAIRIMTRKEGSHYARTVSMSDHIKETQGDDSEDFTSHDIEDISCCVEEEGIRSKKETSQRQLTDFLVNSGRPDPSTIKLVEAYRTAPLGASDTVIAKSAGIHHETAKRLLRKLSLRYDANRFGDVRDYLAV